MDLSPLLIEIIVRIFHSFLEFVAIVGARRRGYPDEP